MGTQPIHHLPSNHSPSSNLNLKVEAQKQETGNRFLGEASALSLQINAIFLRIEEILETDGDRCHALLKKTEQLLARQKKLLTQAELMLR